MCIIQGGNFMADITMCRPIDGCPKKNECYRYRAIPNDRQSWMNNMCGGNGIDTWPHNFQDIEGRRHLMSVNWQEIGLVND